jgi:CBS domain-containing protein
VTAADTPGSELLVAADLMVGDPKTLDADASVAEVRDQLANPKVQLVLLTDGRAFRGAITRLPAEAAPTDPALAYADPEAETISPHASADEAFERAAASPNRRVIVLDDDQNLVGLLCLNPTRTGFCGIAETADSPDAPRGS